MSDCKTCGGTGWQIYMRSWFVADGLRKERCAICAGTGESDYPGWDSAWNSKQAQWRASYPRHPEEA